ncbi:TetR/AcrR family transcriptional regulator [Nonomuraea angiospora]|uniref:TetR/AcrR family transcriptional regulator n=1 Tax=Nonomuraea angiospora TaxID=46172 RepID=UPI003326FDC6
MIADEMGITKAAVYHHFRTREELLSAVVEPALRQLRAGIESAETKRTPHARAEHLLTAYATLAVEHRAVVAVLATDPGAIDLLRGQPESSDLINRQLAILADITPGPAGARSGCGHHAARPPPRRHPSRTRRPDRQGRAPALRCLVLTPAGISRRSHERLLRGRARGRPPRPLRSPGPGRWARGRRRR